MPLITGEFLFTHATPRYSGAFARVAEKAVFSIDCLQVSGTSPSLVVDIEHKNSQDTAWTTAGSFSAITAAGLSTLTLTGALKEMYRYKCTQSGTNAWECIIINPPVWEI